MSRIYTPFVRAAISITRLLGLKGGDGSELSRRIESFARYGELKNTKFYGNSPSEAPVDFSSADVFEIHKTPGKDYRILNIADIHFSDYDYRLIYGFNAMRKVRRLVRKYRPDLITMSGDQTCSEGSVYSAAYLVRCFEKFGIPWAPVFGNHDDESNCDLNYIADEMLKGEHCLFKKGHPSMGCGNYVLKILSGEKPVHSIFMMDFHHGTVNGAQEEWYSDGARQMNCECSVLGHIPVPEFEIAFEQASTDGKKTFRGGYNACGVRGEKICCVREDGKAVPSSFFRRIKESGNTKFIFCAHDHLNDFSLDYGGVRLTYMLKTGKGAGNTHGMNGATLITVGDSGIKNVSHITASYGFPFVIQSADFRDGKCISAKGR